MKVLLLLLCLTVAGCSTYENKFDCPYGKGLGCASLSRVNKMIDGNHIDLDEDEDILSKKQVHIYFGPKQMSKVITTSAPRVM